MSGLSSILNGLKFIYSPYWGLGIEKGYYSAHFNFIQRNVLIATGLKRVINGYGHRSSIITFYNPFNLLISGVCYMLANRKQQNNNLFD